VRSDGADGMPPAGPGLRSSSRRRPAPGGIGADRGGSCPQDSPAWAGRATAVRHAHGTANGSPSPRRLPYILSPDAAHLPIGYFGASTGAAAALWAAAETGSHIAAVVSRGGRPDLAAPRLAAVRAPTLFIVGGDDDLVLELNNQAQAQMQCESRIAVVPEATHLFPEPGALETVAALARDWFLRHLDLIAAHRGG